MPDIIVGMLRMETVVMGKLDGIVGGDVDAGGEGVGDEESENE